MICSIHNKEFKGPNKADNYWHLINFEKQEYCTKPADEVTAAFEQVTREPIKERDYDAENRGKVRHGLVVAMIEHQGLKPLSPEDKAILNELTDFIMGSK